MSLTIIETVTAFSLYKQNKKLGCISIAIVQK